MSLFTEIARASCIIFQQDLIQDLMTACKISGWIC